MLDISAVKWIDISDDYTGGCDCLENRAHYSLQFNESTLEGAGEFLVVGRDSLKSAITDTIPMNVIEPLLREVMKSKLEEKEYKPIINNICVAHFLQFTLRFEKDSIEFFTFSEGRHNKPWQVKVDGKSFVTNSSAPFKLLKKLTPYLHKDVLDSLYTVMRHKSDSLRTDR